MNTMVMNKSQRCGADPQRMRPCPSPLRSRLLLREWARRVGIAVGVAAALGLLVALIAVTPEAVRALALSPAAATVELPRVVIHGRRLPAGACPLPVDSPTAACPVPLNVRP